VVVASFLILAGLMMWTPALATIIAEKAILYPGPILGVISFSPMVILGIAKFFTSLKVPRIKDKEQLQPASPDKTGQASELI
jgi:hypothetical protein